MNNQKNKRYIPIKRNNSKSKIDTNLMKEDKKSPIRQNS
jgi:hypothetical protein